MLEFLDQMNRVAGHYRSLIERQGLEVRHSSDFVLLADEATNMGFAVTPHFCPMFNAFYRDEAFWIGVYDGEQCVAMLAFKRQPLGSESLASYMKRSWVRYYARDSENPVVFANEQKPFMDLTSGNMAYCGEFRVMPKYQQKGIGQLLAAYAKPAAWTFWPDTDMLYIFMENKDVRRGLMVAIELSRQIKNALQWVQHPSQAKRDYWMGASPQRDFVGWLRDEVRNLAVPVLKTLPKRESLLESVS